MRGDIFISACLLYNIAIWVFSLKRSKGADRLMDNRSIGIFDSGIGGLTSTAYIMEELPKERIVFFGDTARTPYGSKSPEKIRQFSMQIGQFMADNHVKMMVIACNTISATALNDLREKFPDIPIIGVISPTARVIANQCSPDDHIGIMATRATVKSGVYVQKIREKNPSLRHIYQKECQAIVPLVEEGITGRVMDELLRYYLDDFIEENRLDTLVLGCTHFPIVAENIHRLYPDLRLISSSREIATAVSIELKNRNLEADEKTGENVFYASDISDSFVNMIQLNLGEDREKLNIQFKNLDL